MLKGADVTMKRLIVGGWEIKNCEIIGVENNNVKMFCYEDNKEIQYEIKTFLDRVEKGNIITEDSVISELQAILNDSKDYKDDPTSIYKLLSSPTPNVNEFDKYNFNGPFKQSYYKSYGTNTKKIYERCCDLYDWDYDDVKYFGRERPCFSEISTPERYDVWMLAHSNWTESNSKKWVNQIYKDAIVQWSFWKGNSQKRERVVFAKTKNQQYIFLGIFVLDSLEKCETDEGILYKETYLRKSTEYPQK